MLTAARMPERKVISPPPQANSKMVLFFILTILHLLLSTFVCDSASQVFRFILVLNVLPFRRTASLREIDIKRDLFVEQKLIASRSVLQSINAIVHAYGDLNGLDQFGGSF
ncbi:hypothetical protein EVAR_43407_1 [Eumeta japonica]|uniref:Uncharacterized protein n=1 Tax=Eumeta variegata TaxID=151549 RepID=A0A4C1WWU2_EUMVA|nr:hypothetical protein EVAR_43407_1 [Eumeta japonica]